MGNLLLAGFYPRSNLKRKARFERYEACAIKVFGKLGDGGIERFLVGGKREQAGPCDIQQRGRFGDQALVDRRHHDNRAVRPTTEAGQLAATQDDQRGLSTRGDQQRSRADPQDFEGRRAVNSSWRRRPPAGRINPGDGQITSQPDPTICAGHQFTAVYLWGRGLRVNNHDFAT
ncbi:MAG TPA: hypothetical protein VHA07_03595 [Devosia sp.]|nr:hypothetical protein [Devosia sp.]